MHFCLSAKMDALFSHTCSFGLLRKFICVAAKGVIHFSVRGFCCALFYLKERKEKMKKEYQKPEILKILVDLQDVLTTSNKIDDIDESNNTSEPPAPSLGN